MGRLSPELRDEARVLSLRFKLGVVGRQGKEMVRPPPGWEVTGDAGGKREAGSQGPWRQSTRGNHHKSPDLQTRPLMVHSIYRCYSHVMF